MLHARGQCQSERIGILTEDRGLGNAVGLEMRKRIDSRTKKNTVDVKDGEK